MNELVLRAILDFISKGILLFIGWKLTQGIVYNYQKNKDAKETRERIAIIDSELTRKYIKSIRQWSYLPFKKSDDPEKWRTAINRLKDTITDFNLASDLLISRLTICFDLTYSETEIIDDFHENIIKFTETIADIIQTEEQGNLDKISGKFPKCLNSLHKIILSAKIK